jgi:hypothetical protein
MTNRRHRLHRIVNWTGALLGILLAIIWLLSVPTVGGRRVVLQWYGPLALVTVWEGKLIWMSWPPGEKISNNWLGSWVGVTEFPDRNSFGLALPGRFQMGRYGASGTAVPFWLPLLIIAALMTAVSILDRRRPLVGHCRKCNYNLTGNTSGICPECGTPCQTATQ